MQPMRVTAGTADVRTSLLELIRERSFSRREVALVSGRPSNFYFDMKPTMFHPSGAAWMAELILQKLAGRKIDYVGGLAVGAVPLVAAVVMLSHHKGTPIPGFFVRSQLKDHGTKRRVEGTSETLAGKSVAILEDVTTTGGSATNAIEAARADGARI